MVLAVAKLPNICWLDRPGDQTRPVKDACLSYGSLPFSHIYRITVYGWPVWSLRKHRFQGSEVNSKVGQSGQLVGGGLSGRSQGRTTLYIDLKSD